jgi:hypothetical protein
MRLPISSRYFVLYHRSLYIQKSFVALEHDICPPVYLIKYRVGKMVSEYNL